MPEIRDWHWTADFKDPAKAPPTARGHALAHLFTNS
jgi:hypothetical protein